MTKKSHIRQLQDFESEFGESLIPALKECASGRWGLFGQNEQIDTAKYIRWSEASLLRKRAAQIHALREESGDANHLVERFLHYCSLRGANVPGEPKLARTFLDEIELSSLTMR